MIGKKKTMRKELKMTTSGKRKSDDIFKLHLLFYFYLKLFNG